MGVNTESGNFRKIRTHAARYGKEKRITQPAIQSADSEGGQEAEQEKRRGEATRTRSLERSLRKQNCSLCLRRGVLVEAEISGRDCRRMVGEEAEDREELGFPTFISLKTKKITSLPLLNPKPLPHRISQHRFFYSDVDFAHQTQIFPCPMRVHTCSASDTNAMRFLPRSCFIV